MSDIRRDYTNKDRPYLTAEISVRKTVDEMRSAMVFDSYMKFRDDLEKHIKDNYERALKYYTTEDLIVENFLYENSNY